MMIIDELAHGHTYASCERVLAQSPVSNLPAGQMLARQLPNLNIRLQETLAHRRQLPVRQPPENNMLASS